MSSGAARPELEAAGTRIGRYRLAYEIASGGQAAIFMAVADGPAGFGKVVALKRLHKHLAKDPQFVSMFLDEARLAAQLTHPNVCGVIDFGVEDGEHYMAMEYLTGVTVAKLASHAQRLDAEGKLDRKRWASIVGHLVIGAAEGLRAAHELRDARGERLNVVHRDVSPQNLMVGFDGSVRVMDFGIAKYDERETQTTALGEVKGKYAYMSPEQARGRSIDRRTDVWALGVIAWELLSLKRLFKRDTSANTILAVVSDPIDPISSVAPGLDAEADAALLLALERDEAQRTEDVRTFAVALRRSLGPVAEASDVATWVQEAFPHAEAEARTMVDLARQSARGVPSIARRDAEASSSNSSIRAPIHTQGHATTVAGGARARRARRPWLAGAALLLVPLAALGAWLGAGMSVPDAPASPPIGAPPEPPPAVPPAEQPETGERAVELPPPEPPTTTPPATTDPTPTSPSTSRPSFRRPRLPEPPSTLPPPPSESPPTPEDRPPPAQPPPSTGTLVVVTPGTWANVYGPGGELWGTTPLRRPLAPGRVNVELRFEGQPPSRTASVDIVAGETGRIVMRE